jgi:gliding motility-associated-like protein
LNLIFRHIRSYFLCIIALAVVCILNPMLAQNSDCATAISVCNATYDENDSPAGTGNVFEMAPGSCQTGGEFNSAWYVFSPQDDGVLSFLLEPDNNNDDYDWSLFDITENGCAGINNGASPEVSCNSYGENSGFQGPTGISSAQGGFGNSNGPGNNNGPAFNADLNVQAGSVYALVIMNYSATLNGYTLDFGSSQASIYDEQAPVLTDVAIDCSRTELTLTFGENIVMANVNNGSVDVFVMGTLYTSNNVASASDNELDNVLIVTFPNPLPAGSASIQPGTQGVIGDVCDNPWVLNQIFEIAATVEITDIVVDAACNGEDGSFEVIATGDSAPFEMSVNGAPANGMSATGLTPGTYVVGLTDTEGCSDEEEVEIEDVIITVDAGADLFLCDMETTLDAQVSAGNILWTGPSDVTFLNSNSASSMVIADDPGTYILSVVSTVGDCTAQDNISIEFNLPPQIDLDITPATCADWCDGKLEVANQIGASVTYSYLGQVIVGETADFEQLCATTSLLEVDFGGNCVATYPINIQAPPAIDVSIDVSDQILDLPLTEVVCTATTQNTSNILWTVTDHPELESTDMVWDLQLPSLSGIYTIQLDGFDVSGCSNRASITVIIRDELAYFIPNAITPNGDGVNDVFLPVFTYRPDAYEMCIYDRWGSCIWRTDDPFLPWTGNCYGGEHFVHDNAYQWIMKYSDKSLEAQTVRGTIMILR